MISPFKAVLGGDYKLVEHRLEGAIRLRFGLTAHMTDEMKARVKQADQAAAFHEATRLAGFDVDEALQFFGAPPAGLSPNMTPLSPTDAQAQFVARFMELQAEMDGG
jgi:5'-deoxynucleotidase YfbR-like HD superfamily hydrolase